MIGAIFMKFGRAPAMMLMVAVMVGVLQWWLGQDLAIRMLARATSRISACGIGAAPPRVAARNAAASTPSQRNVSSSR
jgi:hypothetical protein